MENMRWTRPPRQFAVSADRIEITTEPHTDLWQRTYYHFRNDSAPLLQWEMEERYFSFVVKADFSRSAHRFDQCGVVLYLDSENWLKASVEYENEAFQHLGSVVTNHGYSDWATTAIPADVKVMWYRFSRREDDYCIECSQDGESFSQMRVCHMWEGAGKIRFGIYACSPEDSSFKAVFTHMQLQIAQSHGDAEEKNPDDIGDQRRCTAAVDDILFEGTEGQTGKFEALASVRNPDDGDAPDQPGKPPRQSAQEPAEDEPENIADCFHTGYLERQNIAAQPHEDPIAAIKKV